MKKTELSFLNILFCFLVIFIHTASGAITGFDKGSVLWAAFFVPWRLSAFVVQGFIFLSGLKMFLYFDAAKKTSYQSYIVKKTKKIIIPYIFAVGIFYVFFVKIGWVPMGIKTFLGYVARGNLVSHFYFVIIIVQFYLLKPLWIKMIRRINIKNAFIFAAIITFLSVFLLKKIAWKEFDYSDRIFVTYLIYWVCGCYAGLHYDKFLDVMKKNKILIACIFATALIAELVFSYLQFRGKYSFWWIEILHVIYCTSAIAFCFNVAVRYSNRIMRLTLSKVIDGASYYIYLMHPLFIFIINNLLGGMPEQKLFFARVFFTYAASVLLCGGYVKLKRKIVDIFTKIT